MLLGLVRPTAGWAPEGAALLAAYAAVLVLAGVVVTNRRDVT